MLPTILRQPAVKSASGISRSTIYRLIKQGLWTKTVRVGSSAVGWPDYEISALPLVRIARKSDEAIRILVKNLEENRKSVG